MFLDLIHSWSVAVIDCYIVCDSVSYVVCYVVCDYAIDFLIDEQKYFPVFD